LNAYLSVERLGTFLIYGWDISTSVIGLACFKDDGTFTSAWYCDLRKIDGILEKADVFKSWLEGMSVNVERNNTHFIEERLGGFSGGRTSAQVLMKLGAFNAVASYIIKNHRSGQNSVIVYLHPSTWKSIMKRDGLIIPKGADKKEITLEFAIRKEPQFSSFLEKNRNDKWQVWCYDMADAYCLGRSGYRRLCSVKEN
jgi:hypothetical protein